jgi:hypothetical protein
MAARLEFGVIIPSIRLQAGVFPNAKTLWLDFFDLSNFHDCRALVPFVAGAVHGERLSTHAQSPASPKEGPVV